MNKYKYQFEIDKVFLNEKNLNDEDKFFLEDKDTMSEIQKFVGLPIAIVFEDQEEFPHESFFFAKNQARR